MRELDSKLQLIALLVLLSFPLYSTTIIPFQNLGKLAQSTQTIVFVTANGDYWVEKNGTGYYQTAFEVKAVIKGNLSSGDEIMVQSLRRMKVDMETEIAGDVVFEWGKSYLLFLSEIEDNVYKVKMLSYYVLEAEEKDGREYFIPHHESKYMHTYPRPDGQEVEPLGVYHSNRLMVHLQDVVKQKAVWNKTIVAIGKEVERYFQSVETRAPVGCVYLGSSSTYTGTRWQIFPTVYYETDSSPLLPSGTSKSGLVQTTVNRLNGGYTGVTLITPIGTSGYNPDCANNSNDPVASSNFLPFSDSNLNGSQSIFIQFDDPCSEISALSNCGGTLAYGGSWRSGSHSFNDENWRSSIYGYVVMNQIVDNTGSSNCLTEVEYQTVLMHEVSHALGLGHIDPTSYPNNNMNPSCCNDIGTQDVSCMDHSYVANELPIELTYFEGQKEDKSIKLEWGTASEVNNRFFTLEHSYNGKDFTTIAKITGAGNTTHAIDYDFIDKTPYIGPNYYRLSQTDYDGTTETFEVISIDFTGETKIAIGPNPPVAGHTELTFLSLEEGEVEINIYDLSAQRVHHLSYDLEAGVNRFDLDLADLPAGLYIVNVGSNKLSQTKKLTIL